MSDTQTEDKMSVWCEECEEYIHVVDDVDLEGQCTDCGRNLFQPRNMWSP